MRQITIHSNALVKNVITFNYGRTYLMKEKNRSSKTEIEKKNLKNETTTTTTTQNILARILTTGRCI